MKAYQLLRNEVANAYRLVVPPRENAVVAWGDSQTLGVGSTHGETYPAILSTALGRPVLNRGVGGETSSQVRSRFARARRLHASTTIFWVGRNNYRDVSTVVSDLRAMVEALGHRRFVVGSVLPGPVPKHPQDELNRELAVQYGDHFVDLLSPLLEGAAPEDKADVEARGTPSSFRVDGIHLNNAGNAVVASRFAETIRSLGI